MGPIDFDPYHRWLGIPKSESRPPNHYRLLGIEQFESDIEVISINADRQISHIRKYSRGEHGDLAEKLVNELMVAKLTLLNVQRKTAYDLTLQQQQAVPEEPHSPEPDHTTFDVFEAPPLPPPPAPPTPPPLPTAPPEQIVIEPVFYPRVETPGPVSTAGTLFHPRSHAAWYIVAVCMVTIVILTILLKLQSSSEEDPPSVANLSNNPAHTLPEGTQSEKNSAPIGSAKTNPSKQNKNPQPSISLLPRESLKPVPQNKQVVRGITGRMGELFDRESLNGWVPGKFLRGKWEVINGKLTCTGDRAVIFTEAQDYDQFKLILKMRQFKGSTSITILAHDVSASNAEHGLTFCIGTAIDTGMILDRANRKTIRSKERVDITGNLITVEIVSSPIDCSIKIDGKLLNYVPRSQKFSPQGAISLVQASANGKVEIESIEIRQLDATAVFVERELIDEHFKKEKAKERELAQKPKPAPVPPEEPPPVEKKVEEKVEKHDREKVRITLENIKSEYRRAVTLKRNQMLDEFQVQFDLVQSNTTILPEVKANMLNEIREEWDQCKKFRTVLPKSTYMKEALRRYLDEEKAIRLKTEGEFYDLFKRCHYFYDNRNKVLILNDERNLFLSSPTIDDRRTWVGTSAESSKFYFISETHWAEIDYAGTSRLYKEVSRNKDEIELIDANGAGNSIILKISSTDVKRKRVHQEGVFLPLYNGKWQK